MDTCPIYLLKSLFVRSVCLSRVLCMLSQKWIENQLRSRRRWLGWCVWRLTWKMESKCWWEKGIFVYFCLFLHLKQLWGPNLCLECFFTFCLLSRLLLRMKEVTVADMKVLLVCTQGQFSAIGRQCSHYNAPLVKGKPCNVHTSIRASNFLSFSKNVLHWT